MFCTHIVHLKLETKKRVILVEEVVGIIVLVALLAVLVWQAPAIGSFFQGRNGESEYSQLSLAAGQPVTYTYGDSNYIFSYKLSPADNTGLFYVVKDSQQSRSYPATAGAVYQNFGLEMKVTSANADLAIVLVKPSSA